MQNCHVFLLIDRGNMKDLLFKSPAQEEHLLRLKRTALHVGLVLKPSRDPVESLRSFLEPMMSGARVRGV